ncbi:MAG: AtpZ/AtpI family protein [Planctomycetes bacterium]|nr:AtpZ/AtpI family protein [Planctomycetota bacterium]
MAEGERRERERFAEAARAKGARKERAREEGDRSIWFGLGTFGMVGWSVALPTVGGIAIGVWMDHAHPGGISWTLTLMLAGLAIGCLNAWYWINRESGR